MKTNEELFNEWWEGVMLKDASPKTAFLAACFIKDNINAPIRESKIIKFLEKERMRIIKKTYSKHHIGRVSLITLLLEKCRKIK